MKIRALPSYNKIVGSLGGTAVVIPFGELYSAAEKGVIDGLVWPSVGSGWLQISRSYPIPR